MKLIKALLPYKKYLLLLPLMLLALLIWKAGPHMLIAQHYPLKEPPKRLALILLLFLVWSLKYLLWDSLKPVSPDDHKLAQMLHALRGRFTGATRFLKKTIIDKNGYSTPLNQLPWYLLIGPPGSGKTTLLTNSNINFILAKQKKQDPQEKTIAASSVCDWWVTRDLVLVDVPGYYAFSPAKKTTTDPLNTSEETSIAASTPHTHLVLWQSLLNLLIKYRQKHNIGALVLTLQLPELMKQSRQQQMQWIQDLKQRVVECWAKFGKVPVYFIVSKCDLLPGFSEFFNDIGSDELMQPWGIPLSGRKEHEKLLDLFGDRFNALIKRLNKQLIWRLHQERSPQARHLIKDFPLQLEFLRENLINLIKSLSAANPDFDLEGVYLMSAAQENPAASNSTLFHHDLPSSLEIPPSAPFVSRSYFIKHVISYLLPHTSQHLIQKFRQKKAWLPRAAYCLGIGMVMIVAAGMGRDFQRGLYQLTTVERHLTQFQLYLQHNNSQEATIATLSNAMPLLNTLETATQTATPNTRLEKIESPYSTRSQKSAIEIYHRALQTIILPQVRNEFEKYLETASDKNPQQLYLALKAYLSLRQRAQANKQQTDFIIHTLEQISPAFNKNALPKDFPKTAFLQHLQNAVQISQANSLNNRLINQTRKTLNSLPDKDLAYILVKDMGNNNTESTLNFGTNIGTPPALISKGTITQVPYMFTAQAFPVVIKENLPRAAEETIRGNAVLGQKFPPSDSLVPVVNTIASLNEQLEKAYISNYVDIWESLVDNISLNSPKTMTETDAMIMNLISAHSPLLQLLQTIHNNTNLDPVLATSLKLQALNTLFDKTQSQQKDSLYEIFINLGELHQQLQQPAQHNPQQAESPIAHIHALADKYPEPIKNWLQTLVTYTQAYLQPASKSHAPSKADMQEEAKEEGIAQPGLAQPSLVILQPNKMPELQEPAIGSGNKIGAPTQKRLLANFKKQSLYSKIKESPKDHAPKPRIIEAKAHSKEKSVAVNAEQPKAPAPNSIAVKQVGAHGEYVKILADNSHPMIFVQKD